MWCKIRFQPNFSACEYWVVPQHHLLKRLFFLLLHCLGTVVKNLGSRFYPIYLLLLLLCLIIVCSKFWNQEVWVSSNLLNSLVNNHVFEGSLGFSIQNVMLSVNKKCYFLLSNSCVSYFFFFTNSPGYNLYTALNRQDESYNCLIADLRDKAFWLRTGC